MPQPVVCLGMLLRPYSIGHHLLLIRDGLLESEPDLPHLAQAVLICCQTWRENERMGFDALLDLKLWIWRRRIRSNVRRSTSNAQRSMGAAPLPLGVGSWKLKVGSYLESQLAIFRAYIESGNAEFRISDAPRAEALSSPRLPGSPFILRLQQWLMTELGLSEEAAWDYPIALAKMRWCAHWEQEGGLDVYNEHDAEFDRYVAEQEAKGQQSLESNVLSPESATTQDTRHKTQDCFPEPDSSHNQPSAER